MALFDVTLASRRRTRFAQALERIGPRLVAVCEDNFNFLTKMCLQRIASWRSRCARRRARPGIPAVVNGSDASDRAAEYLERASRP